MAIVEQFLKREDGSEVKIVAQSYVGRGLTLSTGVHVLHRKNLQQNWALASDKPHPDWRSMSVADYCKHGRSEMLQLVSLGEILKTTSLLQANLQS